MEMDFTAYNSTASAEQGQPGERSAMGQAPLGALNAPQEWKGARGVTAERLSEGLSAGDLGVVALDVLRGALNEFIDQGLTQNRKSEVGFMAEAREPLSVGDVVSSMREATRALRAVYGLLVESGPFTYKQRLAIVQIDSAIKDCLLEVSTRSVDGVVGHGDLRSIIRSCIQLSASLGQVIEGLEVLSVSK
jgi:hypothetical protein